MGPRGPAGEPALWKYLLGSFGAATAAVGVGFVVDWGVKKRELSLRCPNYTCDASGADRDSQLISDSNRSGLIGLTLASHGLVALILALAIPAGGLGSPSPVAVGAGVSQARSPFFVWVRPLIAPTVGGLMISASF